MSRQHFHTFDALRFSSFLLVFLIHLPKTGIKYIDIFLNSGVIGVNFFFVLSGFLITYILIYEKQQRQTISLINFFSRRILRIWPLFYLMIAFAYLSPYILNLLNLPSNNEGYSPDLMTSLLFAENYKMMITHSFPDGTPLRVMWSLCIEEHFYIIWGIILYYIKIKNIPYLVVCSVIIANITRFVYTSWGIEYIDVFSHLDFFAYGGIPAYILMCKSHYLKIVERIPKQIKYTFLTLTLTIVFIIPKYPSTVMDFIAPSIFGILFSVVILFTLGKQCIQIKDNLWYSKLGVYTYGLYLYHTIVILLLMQVFKMFSISNWYLLASASLLLTIFMSMASYHLFEKQFLKLKKHFRNNPNNP